MKFTCEKALLVSAISVASRTVAPKSAIPSLEGLLVKAGVKVMLTGYNLETGITVGVPADIAEPGECIMPARLFFDIIRKLPDDEVTVSVDESFRVSIRGGISSFTITAMTAEDYPELPDVESEKGIPVPQRELREMISGTIFSASENMARPIHTGCLFEIADESVTVVAVDGYRLALRRYIPEQPLERTVKFVAPAAALKEVEKILDDTDDPAVKAAVMRARPRLRAVLGRMFPGKLLLCFDSELLNQSLMERVQRIGGVDKLAPGERLCRDMCVPYGKILSDVVVPHIVTKTLHAEKCFDADLRRFDILEFPGYSPLRNQVRMLKSFERPVLLVDDLLHNGYRIEKLDKIFREEGFEPEKIVVAILSGRGRDIMQAQGRAVECEYFIPNLHYWVTESLLYPFLGGDSVEGTRSRKRSLPSINLILPYYYPNYFRDAAPERVYALSETALENALEILRALEKAHQEQFASMLTIRRLGEALYRPRLPEQGQCMLHDGSLPASAYLLDSLQQLDRIRRKEPAEHELL